eukprot:TRINITY_DN4857_c0_g1_i1.p1 TRINITY_DN4857_c0_g1~~TRINITY_DN4857_c0_g1_i1.p1  ORF type:complete len:311 (+),score=49.89 TRINITY_DN4857_c0_g1_i1:87-1019(+)
MPLCQRKGCGVDFNEDENYDGACKYHPGAPIFHEGLKGWSCCKKRFTDFSEFLGHPGCSIGAHTTEVPKADDAQADPNDVIKQLASAEVDRLSLEQRTAEANIRDGADKILLPITVTSSLEKALAKQKAKAAEALESTEVKIGQACTHNACKACYSGPASDEEECHYHPGAPVFHEGYKYWSCCPKKKTYEFDEFLDFKGCTVGKHRWFKPPEELAKAKKCRHDWFQSDTHVVLTIFAKCIEPESAKVTANTDSITVQILYQQSFTYTLELHLGGKIKPDESTVQLMSTKMDIKLLKEPNTEAWEQLSHD